MTHIRKWNCCKRLLSCLLFSLLAGCGPEDTYEPLHKPAADHKPVVAETYRYAVYVENSSSLNGYLNAEGDGNFKDNVFTLISELSSLSGKRSISLFDINSKTIPVAIDADAKQVSDYIRDLNPATFRRRSEANKGSQEQSDLQQVFGAVMDSTHNNDVGLLISDGIFSPGRKANASGYLDEQKGIIRTQVAEKLRRQPFATLVLQFFSEFNGRYYYQNDTHHDGIFKQRPYYIICFGNERALDGLLDHIQNRSNLKGLRDYLFLTPESQYDVKPLLRPFQDYYDYEPGKALTVSDMKKSDRDGKYRIKFGADFSRLPVSKAYLEDKSNYSVAAGFSLESIVPSDKKGFSHECVLVAIRPQMGRLSFSLKKRMPGWVYSTNVDDDLGLSLEALEGKTFGIRYLLDGLFSAYTGYTNTSDYFNFFITVKE